MPPRSRLCWCTWGAGLACSGHLHGGEALGHPPPAERNKPRRTLLGVSAHPEQLQGEQWGQTATQVESLELKGDGDSAEPSPDLLPAHPSKEKKGLHHLTPPDKEAEGSSGRSRPGFLLSALLASLLFTLTTTPHLPLVPDMLFLSLPLPFFPGFHTEVSSCRYSVI